MSRVRGLLTQSGEWQCDCAPRLPAIWLEVKKNNQNKVTSPTLDDVVDKRDVIFILVRNHKRRDVDFSYGTLMLIKREIAQFGETLIASRKKNAEVTTIIMSCHQSEKSRNNQLLLKRLFHCCRNSLLLLFERLYPRLPSAEDDGFEDFETPSKTRPQTRRKASTCR